MTDQDLVRIVTEYRNGILDDLPSDVSGCFAVAWPLSSYLRSILGVQAWLVRGRVGIDEDHDHYWIRLADGRVIDPTADQYGGPPVYLGPLPNEYVEAQGDTDD